MPYQWLPKAGQTRHLHLWPHRSLNQRGFVAFLGSTAALIALPLLAVLGTPVLWALLPFLSFTLWALWFALRKNGRDRDLLEVLTLSPGEITLTHTAPRDAPRHWQANPYWVQVIAYEDAGPVRYYLTLKGGSREVEIGAFLSEAERRLLKQELDREIALLRAMR